MIEVVRLKAILNSLTEFESKQIQRKLLSAKDDLNKMESFLKPHEIFQYLLQMNDRVKGDDIYNFFKDKNALTIKKSIQRITERVYDLLLSREMLLDNSFYDYKSKEVFVIKRKLFVYDILALHGVTKFALNILDQVIKSATNIEYYESLLIALDKKLIKMSLRYGVKEFNRVYSSIEHFSDCLNSARQSQYLLRLYSSNYEFNQKVINELEIAKSIKKIRNDFLRTNSSAVRINLFYLEGVKMYNERQFMKCKTNFIKLYNYLWKNKNKVYESAFFNCILNIAECESMLTNYDLSIVWLNRITKRFFRNEFNEKLIYELKFNNYYFSGNLEQSTGFANKLLITRDLTKISDFLIAKYHYYLSVVEFLNRKYQESNKYLMECSGLNSDKDGWNIGMRVLAILISIETENYIHAEYLIENFRKYLSRIKSESNFYNRALLISKILNLLVSNSFNFKIAEKKSEKLISLLFGNSSKYIWNVKSPEMIPFPDWFDSKVKNVPYNHEEVMKRLRKMNKKK